MALFLKNKKLPDFSLGNFADPDFLLIFAASLLTH